MWPQPTGRSSSSMEAARKSTPRCRPPALKSARSTDCASQTSRRFEVVVSVLAGAVNTRLVAALDSAGAAAVGLTGADAGCGRSEAAPPHQTVDGGTVDLEYVGIPSEAADMRLLITLTRSGFVPVIASIGLGADGRLFNVNADTFAGHLAAKLGARRLVIAGTTAGVLDGAGATLPILDPSAVGAAHSRPHRDSGHDRQTARLRPRARARCNRCRDCRRTRPRLARNGRARRHVSRTRPGWIGEAGLAHKRAWEVEHDDGDATTFRHASCSTCCRRTGGSR